MTPIDWTLLALLILQQGFYSYTIQRLINKIMSRNYAEVLQAEASVRVRKEKSEQQKDLGFVDDYAETQAMKANQLLGGIG